MIYIVYIFCSFLVALLPARRLPVWVLAVLVLVAAFVTPIIPQSWGLFHYHVGSKYFAELGYFELYECAATAAGATAAYRRDLTDYSFESGFSGCSPFARFPEFAQDLAASGFGPEMLRDKGLNASPAWVAVAQIFNRLPVSWLIWLDVVALLVALLVVAFLLGARLALLSGLFMLVFYGTIGHFTGQFGQWWWLALLLVGLALCRRRLNGGFFIGLSAALAVFPALLLVGRSWRVVRSAAFGLLLGLLVGLGNPRGAAAYPEFLQNMMLHSSYIRHEPYNVGLPNALVMLASDGDELRSYVACFRGADCRLDYDFFAPLLPWLLLLPFVLLSRSGVIYGFMTLSRYYYQMMAAALFELPYFCIRLLFGLNGVFLILILLDDEIYYRLSGLLWLTFFIVVSYHRLGSLKLRFPVRLFSWVKSNV